MASRQGQLERAVRLCGAATAIQRSIGVIIPSGPATLYERELQAVRQQLDEATFTRAWTAGQQLTLEQAVAEALEQS